MDSTLPQSPTHGWIKATATRSFCVDDPLLDWLQMYGEMKGFVPDHKREGFDPSTSMGEFLALKGRDFERQVIDAIRQKAEVVTIASTPDLAHSQQAFDDTVAAMRAGAEVVYQPVVWDRVNGAYGIPDLFVRSDVLNRIMCRPELSPDEERIGCEFSGEWHYRVVDIKFMTIELLTGGTVGNSGSSMSKKAQLVVYSRALRQMQGYEPPHAYLLGRSWKQGKDLRGSDCFDRFGPVGVHEVAVLDVVDRAFAWIKKLRTEGRDWDPLSESRPIELYANVSNQQDAPWHAAKREIALQMGELTMLWYVTCGNRSKALDQGIHRWDDPRLDASIFGLSPARTATLDRLLQLQRRTETVVPDKIVSDREVWGIPRPLEFFVDFETVSDVDDDFNGFPQRGGQPLIFMIGCGHLENGEWRFTCFTCDDLTEECEGAIIDAWFAHMAAVTERLMPGGEPLVFHWSHAEESTFESAFNSAKRRHAGRLGRDGQATAEVWPSPNWYDFLKNVIRAEPVVVRGALAFGLKAVAKAMFKHGLIKAEWTDGPGDGLGAMVGAWRCAEEARARGVRMPELELMQGIEMYNEIDCKAMMEIIAYLRAHH